MMLIREFSLFKSRRFFPLFITQFLGGFNDNVFKNALAILITYRIANMVSMNPQALVILAGAIFILPFFLFSATAGQLADKYEKSKLIAIIKFIEIILMAFAAYGLYSENLSLMMLVLFGLGTHSTFFGPLKYSILPDHLQEHELIAGNGVIEAGTFLAILIGTIVGSVVILYQYGAFIISAILLIAASFGWFSSCYIPKSSNYNLNLKINYNIFKETLRLIQYSKQRWDIFLSILGISWFWMFGSIFLLEFPVLAKEVLHANEKIVTLFLILFSIGLGIGSLICNRLLKGKVHATYVPLGVLGMTVFTIDLYFALQHSLNINNELINLTTFLTSFSGWHISLDLLLIAICGGIYTVPLYAILQQRSDKTHRSRVIASNNILNALFMVISAIVVMIMVKLGFTVNQVLLSIGLVNSLVAIYICKLLPDVLIRAIFRCILTLFYRVKVTGLENYTEAGERIIIVANHTSFLDALLLAIFLPDKLTFAVNTYTAKTWWIKLFLRLVDAYHIDPTNPMALKSLIELVQKDIRCVIFPEGRLTVTGALMKIYEGPGLIADKSGAKLLPIRIQGAQFTPFSRLGGKVRIQWFPKITISIFPAQRLAINPDVKGRQRRQKISSKLYDVMTKIMFESGDYQQTLFQSLLDAKFVHGSRHDIIEDVERIPMNYQQFIMRSFILGGVIAKQTKPQEYVGVLLPNMISTVVTLFGLQAFSRIPAMLNYSTGIKNIILACQTAAIKTIYTSRRFITLAKLNDMITALEKENINIIYLEDLRAKITMLAKLKGFLFTKFPTLAYRLLNSKSLRDANNAAIVLFTSGSEGAPKGVVLSHYNIQVNRHQLSSCIDFTPTDTVFNVLPIFHSFGLTAGLILPLLSGVKAFLYPSPLHYRIIPELIYDTNATILFGTDTFLTGYAKYAHQYDFYSLRYVFAGAEKLREETRRVWSQKFGVRIFEGYGATETSPVMSINTPMQNKVGTVGRFLPGICYELNSVPGMTEGGVLSILGPNVMKGYLLANSPGQLVSYENKWYDTGDIVSIDEGGFVTIKGRIKRFAKIAGEMVSLTMVEQQINQLWPAHQHAVMSMPDEKKGEQLILVTTNPQATRDVLVSSAKTNQMSEITIPKKIKILTKMPLLGTGKIDYVTLKASI